LAPDAGFDSDVFVNRSWILATAGADLGTASCDLPAVGSALTTTFTASGQLDSGTPEARLQFDVPEATAVLRIGLNGQVGNASGFFSSANDYDLFVRAESPPTSDVFDCADTNATTFGFCEIDAPRVGTWHVLIRLKKGAGAFQVSATTFAAAALTAPSCNGDCNGDGAVTIDEVLACVNIALGADPATCRSCDADGNGVVAVDELVKTAGFALSGCPAA
jgi:hypothetical protein